MHTETAAFNTPDAFKVTIPVRNNYMYARMKKSLPELYAFTICMWLKSKGPAGVGTPFSYSVPGQANELVLLEWGTNPMELIINDKVKKAISMKVGRHTAYSSLLIAVRSLQNPTALHTLRLKHPHDMGYG